MNKNILNAIMLVLYHLSNRAGKQDYSIENLTRLVNALIHKKSPTSLPLDQDRVTQYLEELRRLRIINKDCALSKTGKKRFESYIQEQTGA